MGAYSPPTQRDKYIFLTGGVLYIYSTERVAKEGDTANKKRDRTRENGSKAEHLRGILSYYEIGAITLFGQI